MPKGGKISATSATRKKHARRAAADEVPLPLPQKKPKPKKGEKPPPKVKQYIPPTRPAPVQIDPLDSLGLASQLDKELVVSLRHLGKKDPITRAKAIDDVDAWVGCHDSSESLGIIPVWLHHFPSLIMNSSRRLRLMSTSLHNRLLDDPALRESIVFNIREAVGVYPLATWCLSAFEADRAVAREASRSWSRVVEWKISLDKEGPVESTLTLEDDQLSDALSDVLIQTLVDPSSLYDTIFPAAPQAPPQTSEKRMLTRGGPRAQEKQEEGTSRKPEVEEENEDDRNARFRTGSLGALRWLISSYGSISGRVEFITSILERIIDHPHTFTVLSQVSVPSGSPRVALGHNQPLVRRGAWALLSAVVPRLDEVKSIAHKIPYVSRCVLFAAWVEPDPTVRNVMWEPLLTYLRTVKDVWLHAASLKPYERTLSHSAADDQNEDSPSDTEDQAEEHPDTASLNNCQSITQSIVYNKFLRFLELGCGGSPSQGYPALVVILATIPSEAILCTEGALRQLFTSIWGAFDGRALSVSLEKERREGTAAFVSAVSECVGVYARRLYLNAPECTLSSDERISLGLGLVREEWSRLWAETLRGGFGLPSPTLGAILGPPLLRLRAVASGLFEAAWVPVASVPLDSSDFETEPVIALAAVSSQFESLANDDARNLQSVVTSLVTKWFHDIIDCPVFDADALPEDALDKLLTKLEALIIHFANRIADDCDISEGISSILESGTTKLIRSVSPRILTSLIITYLNSRPSEQQATWVAVSRSLAQLIHGDDDGRCVASKQVLSLLAQSDRLSNTLLAPETLANCALILLDNILQENGDVNSDVELLRLLLNRRGVFISQAAFDAIYAKMNSYFVRIAPFLLRENPPDLTMSPMLLLLDHMLSTAKDDEHCSFLASVFLIAHASWEDPSALKIWNSWKKIASLDAKAHVKSDITNLLRTAMSDVDSQMRPIDLLELASKASGPDDQTSTILRIFPTQSQFNDEIQGLRVYVPHPSLSIIDPLVPSNTLGARTRVSPTHRFDLRGHSSLARTRIGLLEAVASDRRLVRENGWIIPQLAVLDIFARDFEALPSYPNPFFSDAKGWKASLIEMIAKAQQTLAYAFSSLVSNIPLEWHRNISTAIKNSKTRQPGGLGLGPLADVLANAYWNCVFDNNVLSTRILHYVLHTLLKEAGADEADAWLVLAQTHLDSASAAAPAIIRSVSQTNLQSPRLDRIRNEMASRLSAVRPMKANSEGLRLLKALNASAPPPDSDATFLPQQRIIFMFQAIQKWVQGSEDLDEEVESQLAELFFNVAAIIQSVPGAHWDFVIDLIENNLDNASLISAESQPMVWRTLKLVGEIDELAKSNKVLRETWAERRASVYAQVKKFLVTIIPPGEVSRPRDLCRGLVVEFAAASPETFVDGDSLLSLPHLLMDPSPEVRITAHELLHHASKLYIENVVLETEINNEADAKPALPDELMRIIQTETDENVLSPLLAWMIVFDLFTDASPRVKNSYIDGLRSSRVVEHHLLPTIFSLLGIGAGGKQPFALGVWAVDEFAVSLLDEESSTSIQLLAAHVYYRALVSIPPLIRVWWSDCKDRQLSGAVGSYTSTNFSPSIISGLQAGVRRTDIMESLQGENFTVKLQPAVNDIIAGYLVDEQQMEIALHIPNDYPLRAIDIKDIRRAGVQETKWRMWLLNVGQLAQTGQIVDALFWFKRNVSSFFEGKVECAICYSVISVMDRSLPNKPCKTCKNRFHASCLYKWFNTSHSSSCPLCRSNIM